MANNVNRSNDHGEIGEDYKNEFEEFYKNYPLTEDTKGGIWIFKGPKFQFLANKKALIVLIGITSCLLSSTFSYFGGTITTIEKRFKISNKTTGIILVGNDIPKLFASIFLSYYTSFGHRPRWIAVGLLLSSLFCFMNALPHFLYGPGSDALQLTLEYGANYNISKNDSQSINRNNHLCAPKVEEECIIEEGNFVPPLILFMSQFIVGFATSFYHSLTFSYLDDNIKKTKSPAMLSFTHFMRMFGPALGYSIVSACLKFYIDPNLTPAINNSDPRWLGAWWIGWLILGPILIIFAGIMSMLPKTLPRAAARRDFYKLKLKIAPENSELTPSLKGLFKTVKRLLKNKIYVYTTFSSIFCIFGYNPFWIYLPKYIEVQYNQTASTASFVTGTTGLIFMGIGTLLGGIGVQKFKPKARSVALWNTFIDFVFVSGIIAYTFLGCDAVDNQTTRFPNENIDSNVSCTANCECDYVKFSPICALGLNQTFISACHAGCTQQHKIDNGVIIFSNCSCIPPPEVFPSFLSENTSIFSNESSHGFATSGPCAINCQYEFYLFIFVKCLTKMFGAMSKVTFFLVAVRCVKEKDKSVSLGFSSAIIGFLALLPSPIFFGYIIDSTCLMWGKTCSRKGNCWFYDTKLFRKRLTYTSAAFVFVGIIFDFFVVKHVKDLNMFDENPQQISKSKEEISLISKEREKNES